MPQHRRYTEGNQKIELPVEIRLTDIFANMTGEDVYLSFKELGEVDAQEQIREFLRCYAEDYGYAEILQALALELDVQVLVEDFARADLLPNLAEEVIQNTAPEVILDMLEMGGAVKLFDVLNLIARDERALIHALRVLTIQGKDTIKEMNCCAKVELIQKLADYDAVPS